MPDRAGGHRAAHSAKVAVAIVAGLDQPERAVRLNTCEGVGKVVADVRFHVVEHDGVPHLAGVVEHGLVVQGEIRGPHDTTATGHPDPLHGRVVEAHQSVGRDFTDLDLADAERCEQLVRRRRLADDDEFFRRLGNIAEDPAETGGSARPLLDDIAIVASGDALDHFGQHPVGRRRVILEPCAGLPVEPPTSECGRPAGARVAIENGHRRIRKTRGVQHHLLERDALLAVRCKLGHIVADTVGDVDQAIADQCPHGAGHEGLRRRVDDEARSVNGVAERLERNEFAVVGQRNLGRRQQTLVDFASCPIKQLLHSGLIDTHIGPFCRGRAYEEIRSIRRTGPYPP